MPRRVSISKDEVYDNAVAAALQCVSGIMHDGFIQLDCVDEDNHYCHHNWMIEHGWLRPVPLGVAPLSAHLYTLTYEGSDNFCHQMLRHSLREGPFHDMFVNIFKEHPNEYKIWWQNIQEEKVHEFLDEDDE
jgi:hypothetical protein